MTLPIIITLSSWSLTAQWSLRTVGKSIEPSTNPVSEFIMIEVSTVEVVAEPTGRVTPPASHRPSFSKTADEAYLPVIN